MLIILLSLLTIQLTQACIPLGLGANCNCAQNPTCGQCPLPPPPPVQQCCSYSNDAQPSFGPPNSVQYLASEVIPTANNQYPQALQPPQQFSPQQPVAIPIAQPAEYANQPPQNPTEINNNYINEKDQQLRNAIAEYNAKEHMSFPFPDDTTTHKPSKKPSAVSPPGKAPPTDADEYGGLPSIYFTMRPNTSGTKPTKTTTDTSNPYESNDAASSQKTNVSIQNTTAESTTANGYEETTNAPTDSTTAETTTGSTKSNSHAYAFASGTYWAVLEERETDDGLTHQRRIPYHAYEQEVCTGATLGRSIERNVEDVAIKCTMIGCAAVNVRPIFDDQYEAIYLKNVNARRPIRGSKTYSCITIVDVPEHESVYQKEKQFEEKQNRRRMPVMINQPTRLRFVSIEPKAVYN